ncbi:unnamed protein product, partial [Strongylus vulgaris]
MELMRLLEKYSENREVAKIIQEIKSEKIELSASSIQEITTAIAEMSKVSQTESISQAAASSIREVLTKSVKETIEETLYTIVKSIETTSTTQLAKTLAASSSVEARLRAAEQEEASIALELVRNLLEDRSTTLKEEHRAYIQERFGINVGTLMSTFEKISSAETVTQEFSEIETRTERKTVHEYGQESVAVQGDLQILQRPKEQEDAAESVRKTRHYLHLLHSVAATSEEQAKLVQLLSKYQSDEHVASVIRELTSGRVVWSGLAVRTITSILEKEIARHEETSEISRVVSDTLRTAISQVVREVVDENAFAMIRTSEEMPATEVVKALSSHETVAVHVEAPEETASSTTIDL